MASQWSLARMYDPDDEVNLSGLSGSLATYAAAVTGLVALGRATGRELPGPLPAGQDEDDPATGFVDEGPR